MVTTRARRHGLPDTDVHAFGAAGSTLYAAGPANGVIASTDGGKNWETRTDNAGQSFFGRILIGPNDDQHLVAADARAGAMESIDGGRAWRRLGVLSSGLCVRAAPAVDPSRCSVAGLGRGGRPERASLRYRRCGDPSPALRPAPSYDLAWPGNGLTEGWQGDLS